MLRWSLAFMGVALAAAFIGFEGGPSATAGITRGSFYVCLCILSVLGVGWAVARKAPRLPPSTEPDTAPNSNLPSFARSKSGGGDLTNC